MRVLILGGGAVSYLVARRLIREKNEVTIVERDQQRCEDLQELLDAKIVQGNAASIETLERAGIKRAQMIIAATDNDQINIMGTLIAQNYQNLEIKVMRLRTHEALRWQELAAHQSFRVDRVIHPDGEAADRLLRVVSLPGVSDVRSFMDGRVRLFGMNIRDDSWLVGKSMRELDESSPPKHSLICMIFRGHRVIIPRGDDLLMAGDHVYVVVATDEFEECMEFMGLPSSERAQRVFILGGNQIGIELARRLEKTGVQVKLFERDRQRCEKISTLVRRTVVVHADGTDQRVLAEENVEGIDAYMALTTRDENNIIASLLAKRLGARKAIALVNRLDLLPIVPLLGINASLSLRLVTVDRILQFVRKGRVLSVHTFRQEEAEAIELLATEGSPFVNKKLRKVHLPHTAIIGAIGRKDGGVLVPRGDTVIRPGDRVIFFCLEHVVPELEAAFIAEH